MYTARSIAIDVEKGTIRPEDIDSDSLMQRTKYGQRGIPNPDLVIRTGGRMRMSNYVMLNIAESELVFFETLWPDFTPEHFNTAINIYCQATRTFGDVPASQAH